MEAQLNSIISAIFRTSLRTQILKINFCKYSICSVYIVKSLPFFCFEAIFIIFSRTLIVTSLLPTPLLFINLLPRTGFTDPVFISLIVAVSFGAVQFLTSEVVNSFCRILKISHSRGYQGVLSSSFNHKFITC